MFLLPGIALASAGAGALNHWAERDRDARMRRTRSRPLPSGRLSPGAALWLGIGLAGAGGVLLALLVNPLTATLAMASVVLYLAVYTPLKSRSTWNTLVGTVPGALPALCGWTAATGAIGWRGAATFAILAAWQMPHALAIAWIHREDYERGGFRMLPSADPSGLATALWIVGSAAVLVVASLWPTALGLTGAVYFGGAIGLGMWSLTAAIRFFRGRSVPDARRVLRVSILWVPALLALVIADRLVFLSLS